MHVHECWKVAASSNFIPITTCVRILDPQHVKVTADFNYAQTNASYLHVSAESYDSLDPKQPILPAEDCAGLLRGIY